MIVDELELYKKFNVRRVDGKKKHEHCQYFVLDLTHDPHARKAARIYAESVREERPTLSSDLLRLIENIVL